MEKHDVIIQQGDPSQHRLQGIMKRFNRTLADRLFSYQYHKESPCIMCVQYRGVLSTMGVFSTMGDIMSTVGVILSIMGDVQYCGGYHDARGGYHEYHEGCSVPWRENVLLFEYPTVLNTPTVLMISPTCIMISPQYSNFKGWYPPWY